MDKETNVEAVQLVRLGFSGNWWYPNITPGGIRAEREATEEALRAVGATQIAEKPLGAMSGGELQRIFLAEALVGRPGATAPRRAACELGPSPDRELVDLINGLVRNRTVATLLVAHDINPLIRYLDKVVYIANGRVATGPPSEVLTTENLFRRSTASGWKSSGTRGEIS